MSERRITGPAHRTTTTAGPFREPSLAFKWRARADDLRAFRKRIEANNDPRPVPWYELQTLDQIIETCAADFDRARAGGVL